jgi:hypothetical protein
MSARSFSGRGMKTRRCGWSGRSCEKRRSPLEGGRPAAGDAYSWIAAKKTNYPVAVMCRMLHVSVTGFHNWEPPAPGHAPRANRPPASQQLQPTNELRPAAAPRPPSEHVKTVGRLPTGNAPDHVQLGLLWRFLAVDDGPMQDQYARREDRQRPEWDAPSTLRSALDPAEAGPDDPDHPSVCVAATSDNPAGCPTVDARRASGITLSG